MRIPTLALAAALLLVADCYGQQPGSTATYSYITYTGTAQDVTGPIDVKALIGNIQHPSGFNALIIGSCPLYQIGLNMVPTAGSQGLYGTVTGQMSRCTDPDLLAKCPAIGQRYVVPCKGTFRAIAAGRQKVLQFEIDFKMPVWNKTTCKQTTKTKDCKVVIIVSVPVVSSSGGGGWINWDDIIDSVLYSPETHPLNPANRR